MTDTHFRSRRPATAARRFGLLFVLALALWVPSTAGAQADGEPIRIAVVNLDLVVAQSPAGRSLQTQLQQFTEAVQAEVATKSENASAIRKRIEDGANSLSEERLAELRQDFEDAQIAIRRFQEEKQREGTKMQEEGLKQIEQQLEPVFKQIRDEDGYDLILNNVPGVIVMAGPRVDITGKVITRLQATSSGG